MALVSKAVKLPHALAAALTRRAVELGCSESELIREGLVKVLAEDGIDMQAAIGADLGIGAGPANLSSARRVAGYGRSRRR
jgi:hypothetical protein